jgi:S1-C subfamily serine protease
VSRNASIAIAAAAAGLAGGVLGAAIVGWTGSDDSTRTVVVRTTSPPMDTGGQLASAPIPRTRFDPARIYATRAPGVVTIYSYFGAPTEVDPHAAQGSGFVVNRQGYILTNAHVITTAPASSLRVAETVFVEFADGDRASARVVGYDLFSDVGLLKTDPADHALAPVPLGNSRRIDVGEPVAAIGSPFGRQESLTVGVVSGTQRSISSLTSDYDLADAIQTDAPINRGNSGGPLFDASGRVIGINAQIRSDTGVNEGVGFAIPINIARRAMRDLLHGRKVRYAYIGVSTQNLTPAVADKLGYGTDYGALVACVENDSPADRAGLHGGNGRQTVLGIPELVEGGDVIVGVNGHAVRSGSDLVRIVSEDLRPARTARFTIVRGAERKQVRVRLAERPAKPSAGCSG